MNMNNKWLSYIISVTLITISVFAAGWLIKSFSGGTKDGSLIGVASRPIYYVYDYVNGLYVSGSQIFDSSANATLPGTLAVTGNATLSGSLTLTGAMTYKESITSIASTLTTTLTAADSGKTFLIGGTTSTVILPATSSLSTGTNYRFVVGRALTVSSTVVTVTGANEIEGTLIVAGAVVDCDAEDTITFGASLENIGDYFDITWSGTYWLLGDSGALTGSSLACSAT